MNREITIDNTLIGIIKVNPLDMENTLINGRNAVWEGFNHLLMTRDLERKWKRTILNKEKWFLVLNAVATTIDSGRVESLKRTLTTMCFEYYNIELIELLR
jgi:hypothetical protein